MIYNMIYIYVWYNIYIIILFSYCIPMCDAMICLLYSKYLICHELALSGVYFALWLLSGLHGLLSKYMKKSKWILGLKSCVLNRTDDTHLNLKISKVSKMSGGAATKVWIPPRISWEARFPSQRKLNVKCSESRSVLDLQEDRVGSEKCKGSRGRNK
jgi:hypothetical protein